MFDLTALETMTEYENQKKILESLQSRLEEAEQQILDGEKLRKKLHNTILVRSPGLPKVQYIYLPIFKVISLQELKGNIRVFCRVRPLLPNESGAISYPKNGENIGRGIELMHNGKVLYIHFYDFDILFLRFYFGLIAFLIVFSSIIFIYF